MLDVLIKPMLFPEGFWVGVPCLFVHFHKGDGSQSMELNDLLTEILKRPERRIVISGNLSKEPEIKTVIAGLVSRGKIITFATVGSDSIEAIRPIRNVRIFLKVVPPTKEENILELRNFPLLKEDDEIRIPIGNMTDYDNALKFLKSRVITRPTILFSLTDVKNAVEIIQRYLEENSKYMFKSRISNQNL